MHSIRLGFALARAGFKLQYEGNYLGILWHFLNPLAAFVVIFLVFSHFFGSDVEHYPLYLLSGLIIFNFFRSITVESTAVIRNSRHIIKSISFPKEALIIAPILRAAYAHLFDILVFIVLLIFSNLSVVQVLFYPFVFIIIAIFVYGMALGLSAISVNVMDISSVWAGLAQALWFATPIFYYSDQFLILHTFNLFNPLYYFITIARDILIYGQMPQLWMTFSAIGFSVVSLMLGSLIFKNTKIKFVEKI
jgi:ABC-type polysaccharide/polyol phosphate export permease